MSTKEGMTASRRAQLARIHLQFQQLGLDDEVRREVMCRLTGCSSSADMNVKQRGKVLDYLSRQLGVRGYPKRPHSLDSREAPQAPSLKKVEAFLSEAKRPWSYADAIAQRVAKVECCTFLDEAGAQKVLQALWYDARRHGRRTA
ncbi:MAG: regulatory protein GemA [Myxococcales bacterium]|jgi:phage gp16-like protein|nr:regulatory protein GemA [Myxococcales bacterium]